MHFTTAAEAAPQEIKSALADAIEVGSWVSIPGLPENMLRTAVDYFSALQQGHLPGAERLFAEFKMHIEAYSYLGVNHNPRFPGEPEPGDPTESGVAGEPVVFRASEYVGSPGAVSA